MKHRVVVVGATGAVGREMLSVLAERNFPVQDVHALASSDSVGKLVAFGDERDLKVQATDDFKFATGDIVLMSVGADLAKVIAPRAVQQGAVVIDNSSAFRMDDGVPLVVPEVNPQAIAQYKTRGIIANPNCSTIQMVVALKPLHTQYGVEKVVVTSLQSVSGAGKPAMDELYAQTKGVFTNENLPPHNFKKTIAFNVIPQIDEFMDNGFTKEEWKMRMETKKIMGNNAIEVAATCVRVPVFIGHSLAVHVTCARAVDVDEVHELLGDADGITVFDRPSEYTYITPKEIAREDNVYISRLRVDAANPKALMLWIVADNLRKGAALNAVQIAELLLKQM